MHQRFSIKGYNYSVYGLGKAVQVLVSVGALLWPSLYIFVNVLLSHMSVVIMACHLCRAEYLALNGDLCF